MRVVKPDEVAPATPLTTYYVERFDKKTFTVLARYYYRTEASYVFTMASPEDVHKAYMRGTPFHIKPIVEIDAEIVSMIVDQDLLSLEPEVKKAPRRKKPVDKSKTSK